MTNTDIYRAPFPSDLHELVRDHLATLARGGKTPEDIANDDVLLVGMGTPRRRQILVAVHWLIQNGYASLDPRTNVVTIRP
jgi:hypothetical protein